MMNLSDILLPYQKKFVDSKRKNKLFLTGRQIGKSFTLAYLATKKVLTSKRGQNALALVISTGARAASEFLKKCQQMAESVSILEPSITYTATADTIKFSGGQRIISLPSGNPPALRGYTADIILIDEAAYIERPDDVWSSIAPTLTRNPDAELVLASTPAGKASWFYEKVQEARGDRKTWHFQETTIEDAVKDGLQIDLEALRRTISDPDTWDREYMCKFAADFSSLIDTAILDFAELDQKPIAKWMGMDVGSTSDRTAVVTLAELPDHTFFVEDVAMLHKASYEHQLDILKQLHSVHSYTAGFIDANGLGGPIAEFATKQVSAKLRGFTWTGSNKTPAYEHLRAMCFDHKLKFASHIKDLVVNDFNNVHRVVSEAGRVSYEAGRNADGHSDFTSALVLALQAAAGTPHQLQMPVAGQVKSVFSRHPLCYGTVRSRL